VNSFFVGFRLDYFAHPLNLPDVAAARLAGEKMQFQCDFFTNRQPSFAGFGSERQQNFARRKSSRQKQNRAAEIFFALPETIFSVGIKYPFITFSIILIKS